LGNLSKNAKIVGLLGGGFNASLERFDLVHEAVSGGFNYGVDRDDLSNIFSSIE
jgi:hypothetical protein